MGVVEVTVQDLLGESQLAVEPARASRERRSPGAHKDIWDSPGTDGDQVVLNALVVDKLVLLEDAHGDLGGPNGGGAGGGEGPRELGCSESIAKSKDHGALSRRDGTRFSRSKREREAAQPLPLPRCEDGGRRVGLCGGATQVLTLV